MRLCPYETDCTRLGLLLVHTLCTCSPTPHTTTTWQSWSLWPLISMKPCPRNMASRIPRSLPRADIPSAQNEQHDLASPMDRLPNRPLLTLASKPSWCFSSCRNVTLLNEQIAPAWMPPATVRGTVDILYTCVFTITLCVYTAIHINVPPRGASPMWWYLRKFKWTITGISAPEAVLVTAVNQFQQAMRLRKALNNEINKPARNQKQGASRGARLLTRRLR